MDKQKALKNTFQASTTFKVEENLRSFEELAQKCKAFKEKMEFKGFNFPGLPLKFKDFSRMCKPRLFQLACPLWATVPIFYGKFLIMQ